MQTLTKRPASKPETSVGAKLDAALAQAALESLTSLTDEELTRLVKQQFAQDAERGDLSQVTQGLAQRLERIAAAFAANESTELLKSAREQAQAFRGHMVETKKLLPSKQFCEALGLSRQALSRAMAAHRMFAIEFGGENYYPTFFADPNLKRRELEAVCKELGGLGGSSKWQFFTTPKLTLEGKTPLKALAAGGLKSVLDAARGFAAL